MGDFNVDLLPEFLHDYRSRFAQAGDHHYWRSIALEGFCEQHKVAHMGAEYHSVPAGQDVDQIAAAAAAAAAAAGEGGENTAIAADDGAAAGLAVNCCHRHGGRHCCPSDGIDDCQLPEEASMNISALVILEQFFDRSHA